MQLEYSKLLKDFEELRNGANRLIDELIRNGVVVNMNPQTVEVQDIHDSIFKDKYYFDGYDVLLDFTDHDMKVINKYKNSKGDKEMEKSKMVEEMQELREKVSKLNLEKAMLRMNCVSETARELFDKGEFNDIVVCEKGFENEKCVCRLNFDSPLDFAKSIIEHKTHVDGWTIESDEFKTEIPDHERVTFGYDELIEIAEYLLIYCKHNKEDL